MPNTSPGEGNNHETRGAEQPTFVDSGIPWGAGFGLFTTVLLVVFAVQNTQDVQIRFLAWDWAVPLVIVVVGVIVLTVITTSISGWALRKRRQHRAAEKAELRRLRHER